MTLWQTILGPAAHQRRSDLTFASSIRSNLTPLPRKQNVDCSGPSRNLAHRTNPWS